MLIVETSFVQAVEDFKRFLAEGNLPTDILWVFLEDVYSRNVNYFGKDLWIKLPLPDENERLAEKQYKMGQERNLGICLTAFAICENKICCHLMIPKDKEESENMLMLMAPVEPLKFTYLTEMPNAQAVKSSFRWKLFGILPFKYKQGNYSEHLQSKKDLKFSAF